MPGLRCASLLDRGRVGGDTRSGRRHGPEIQWSVRVKVEVKEFKHAETLLGIYWDIAGTLRRCYRDNTVMVQGWYRDVTGTIQEHYRNITGLFQECYRDVTETLH